MGNESTDCLYGIEARQLRIKARDAAYELYGDDWADYVPRRVFWDLGMSSYERRLLEEIIEKAEKMDNGRQTQ